MTTTDTAELTWTRSTTGNYIARHAFWVYSVGRNDSQPKGQQWYLEAWPEAHIEAVQRRTGFHTMKLAKAAASGTRCDNCGRHVPFGSLETEKPHNRWPVWRCRDRETCEAAGKERHGRLAGFMPAEPERQDHLDAWVDDTAEGPDLVFVDSNGNRTRVQLTDNTLMKLTLLLASRVLERHEHR
jgi:hypothetical protein